jgi:hypothetical protein
LIGRRCLWETVCDHVASFRSKRKLNHRVSCMK